MGTRRDQFLDLLHGPFHRLPGNYYSPVDGGHAQKLHLLTATNLAFLAVDLQFRVSAR